MALGKAATSSPRRPENGPVVSALPLASTRNNNLVNSARELEQRLPLVQLDGPSNSSIGREVIGGET